METQKRKFTAELKSKMVLEMLKEEKSVAEISGEYEIHPAQLNRWKREAIEAFPQLFMDKQKETSHMKKKYEQKIEELYKEVGKLTTHLSWIKKKSGISMD
jgi:putative transposase